VDDREWADLVRAVAPGEAWAFRGTLCYSLPVGRVLFGVDVERIPGADAVHITRVACPLLVPVTRIRGGMRVSGTHGEWISTISDDVRGIVRSVLKTGYREREELETFVHDGLVSTDALRNEIAGYALLLLGDQPSALRILRRALDRALAHLEADEGGMRERTELICGLLEAGDAAGARAQLQRWTEWSIRELGIVNVHTLSPKARRALLRRRGR
jgi:hypothetical protein